MCNQNRVLDESSGDSVVILLFVEAASVFPNLNFMIQLNPFPIKQYMVKIEPRLYSQRVILIFWPQNKIFSIRAKVSLDYVKKLTSRARSQPHNEPKINSKAERD